MFFLHRTALRTAAVLAAMAAAVLSGAHAHAASATGSNLPNAAPVRILFIGNSFTYGEHAPVHYYRAQTVTDLNHEGIGGVPALFKAFTEEAGQRYDVSLETSPGKDFDWHLANRAETITRSWDVVVAQSFSTLNAARPGDPTRLVASTRRLATLLHGQDPDVAIYLTATWSRADQTYLPTGHWYGKPIDAMEKDVRAGYDLAAAGSPYVKGVLPVGEVWNRAMQTGFADADPYDGIDAGKVDLWAYDNYHASTFGYYLEALTVFGRVTGLDPRSLGGGERCAYELGLSPEQAVAMERIVSDQLSDEGGKALQAFSPLPLSRPDAAPDGGPPR